ncbi:MAG: hypothetical protein H6867_03990 [Rhodospirillales bacterium]|nr:hypothetical protein [Rhodospirillales bacterium]MCB9996312.1 hypothetical protein [Rhodospirillales bacterium]
MGRKKIKLGLIFAALLSHHASIGDDLALSGPITDIEADLHDLPNSAWLVPELPKDACPQDLAADDLSQNAIDQGTTLPASCYKDAVYFIRERALLATEAGFVENGVDQKIAQDIRQHALFYTMKAAPRIANAETAVMFGADLHRPNERGETLGETIISSQAYGQNFQDKWNVMQHLYTRYKMDVGFLKNRPDFLWGLIAESKIDSVTQGITPVLNFIQNAIGVDLKSLRAPGTGANLLHLAAGKGSEELLRYIQDHQLKLSFWDDRGYHALDYAPDNFRDTVIKYTGLPKAGPAQHRPRAQTPYAEIKQYLQTVSPSYIDVTQWKRADEIVAPASDFNTFPSLHYTANPIGENKLSPVLIIAEQTRESPAGGAHIEDTSRVAMGVSRALGDPEWARIISIAQNPTSYQAGPLDFVLQYNFDDYVIVSQSIELVTDNGGALTSYNKYSNFYPPYLDTVDDKNYIHYNSAGNEGTKPCLSVDGVDFCLQHSSPDYHSMTNVRVGAARHSKADRIVVEDYSEMRPAFCALLPKKNGEFYSGTSFTSPAAASVEKKLAGVFARSATMPYGMTHEDILMALMMTAQPHGMIDEATSKITPVFYNAAGLAMNDRCGAGVIDPQRAEKLLYQMTLWSLYMPGITPSAPQTVRLTFDKSDIVTRHDNRITYRMTVPRDGIITQVRAGIPFETSTDKGAALIEIGTDKPRALDLSPSGLTTDFRFAGQQLKTGDTIRITVTKPLAEPKSRFDAKPFIDLRMVQINSPVNMALLYGKSLGFTQ